MMNSLGINKPCKETKVVVAMSGGVDSSVVAALMKEEGYNVTGITLKLYDDIKQSKEGRQCCAGQDIMDAKRVSEKINIKHEILYYQKKFKSEVIDSFIDSYAAGETPIPCVQCNQTVKFRDLFRYARELKAPAFIPAKAKHMIRDCKLIAEKNNIKFKFNSYFPIRSLNLMRGVFVAEEDNFKSYYIDNIFDSIWQDGLNMNDENIIQKVLKNLNVNPKTFTLRATSSSIKESLKKRTSEAYEKGIFGAPTFVSNNKLFWGQDRIEFVLKEASK